MDAHVRRNRGGQLNGLLNSEEQFRAALHELRFRATLIDQVQCAAIATDMEGKITHWNRFAEELYGWKRAEVIGENILDVTVPSQSRKIAAAILEKLLTVGSWSGEFEVRRKDGSVFLADVVDSIVRDESGVPLGFVGISTDTTEQHRLHLALQESESRFRLFMDHLPGYAWIKKADGTYVYMNERLQKILPNHRYDWQGRTDAEIWPAYLAAEYDKNDKHVLCTGRPLQTTEVVNQDGQIRYCLVSKFPILDQRKVPVMTAGAAIDITDRKEAEEFLKHKLELLDTIFDHSPVMISLVGQDGRIQLVNRLWEETLGWSFEETQTADIFEGCYPDPQQREDVLDFIRRAEGTWRDFRTRLRDGRFLDTSWAVVNISDGTNIGIGQDITERKRVQQELVESLTQVRELAGHLQTIREEERTRLAREMHDELGQGLTAIKIELSSLAHDLSPAQLKKTECILKMLDKTIKSVRKLSSELRPGILDDLGLIAAVEWAAEEFQTRTGIQCHLYLPDEADGIDSDRSTALFRIFQESLTNVVRHANATTVVVRFMQQAGAMIFQVEDNGRGITDEQQFARSSLGILGMKERALLIGGELTISGAPSKGTMVQVRIPLLNSERSASG